MHAESQETTQRSVRTVGVSVAAEARDSGTDELASHSPGTEHIFFRVLRRSLVLVRTSYPFFLGMTRKI